MLSDFIKFQQPPHIGNQGLKEIEPDIKPAKLELRRESIGFFDMLKPKMKTTPIKEIELPIVNDGIIDAKMQSNKINNLDEQVFGSKLPKPILTRDKPEVHLYHMDKKSNLDIQRENAINEQKYGQAENLPEDEQKLNEMENDVNEMEQLMREKTESLCVYKEIKLYRIETSWFNGKKITYLAEKKNRRNENEDLHLETKKMKSFFSKTKNQNSVLAFLRV